MILLTVGLSGCTSDTEYTDSGSSPSPKLSDSLNITNHSMKYGEFGNLFVTGTAKNIGNKRITYAEIDVKFYDENDNLLSTSFDNVNDLDPNETWLFEVLCFESDTSKVDHYKIGVGTIW